MFSFERVPTAAGRVPVICDTVTSNSGWQQQFQKRFPPEKYPVALQHSRGTATGKYLPERVC